MAVVPCVRTHMARLSLSFFGSPQVLLEGVPISSFRYNKVFALLVYLAVEHDRPHQRALLAGMLWPDQPERAARRSLSQAVFILHQVIGDDQAELPCLLVAGSSLQLNPAADWSLDIAVSSQLLAACTVHQHDNIEACTECVQRLEACAALYHGDFLAGFSLADSPTFDEWASQTRERLHHQALATLETLAAWSERRDGQAAIPWLRRLLELDPWREEAHRQLMRAYSSSGDRAAALAQYERCRLALADELGLEPEEETTLLMAQIRRGEVSRRNGVPVASEPVETPVVSRRSRLMSARRDLPAATTPLVGREREQGEIAGLLADPACRIITLVGPGGIGKTRLALAVAEACSPARAVAWVSLAGFRTPDLVAFAIADALGFHFHGQASPQEQLLDSLGTTDVLLVLDNFEHVLAAAPLIAAIEKHAPYVTMLVTSHERLNLRAEWVMVVQGLATPSGDDASTLVLASAARMFAQCVYRIHPQREFAATEWHDIARICQLVGGMPLGIELAATWSALLSCGEIADEIAQGLDFLATSARDMPDRHRSMRAVFDYTWQLLGTHERAVFIRLSIFRGGFTREGAEAVANADLPTLLALANKSLLRRGAHGRYEIHELLRQYGEEKRCADIVVEQTTRDAHADYIATFLAHSEQRLKSGDQLAAIADVGAELENVRAAYGWLADTSDWKTLGASLGGLFVFFAATGRAWEAETVFRSAIDGLMHGAGTSAELAPAQSIVFGRLLCAQGAFTMRLGRYEEAQAMLGHSLELLRPHTVPSDIALALNMLAATLHLRGQYENEVAVLQESIALGRAAADRWITAYSLNDLGMAIFHRGDSHAALPYAQEALGVFQQIGDQRGASFALNNLGIFTLHLGETTQAERLFRSSLEVRRAISDRWGIATTLTQIGKVVGVRGQLHESFVYFREALGLAMEVRALPAALDALVEWGAHLACDGDVNQASAMLKLSLRHPAASRNARERASQLLALLPPRSATDILVQPNTRNADRELAAFVASLTQESRT